ncbi:MAG: hypothetical protein HOC71_10575 [Candidatus Latescibacteria bacterium]|jgi:hypothetical protein|nr:hypothetical protein [Candidatus Latescibacterota bacterium]
MYNRFLLKKLFIILVVGIILNPGSGDTQNSDFTFALIGDIPRFGDAAIEPELKPFLRLRSEINKSGVKFVIHDGDFKSGGSPCSDDEFYRWKTLIDTFEMPFFFINGDNEWTDCYTKKAGGYDPLERLAKLRELFYSTPTSLGKRTLRVERQSDNPQEPRFGKYSDNFYWVYGNIMFVGLNVQGSNNNLGRTPRMDKEFNERNDAVNAFMHDAFALAKKNKNLAIVITIQANPRFDRPKNDPKPDGYKDFRREIEVETLAFDGKPVILVHGDSHYFRIDKPMKSSKSKRRIENFTRVETFGTPDVHWLLVTVDYDNPNLFIFEPRIVRENIIDHSN